ncbi:holin-like protein [Reinekea marinisedimentorum]|uniref:Holin-like protein n=1 Tax=Reinekea marinisedimentorum TaxID=230495 RepID=A0A4R3I3V9_9GAMM|nr:holin-like protein [Reinekea marinisedimentorum]
MLCAGFSWVVSVAGIFVLILFWLGGSALVEFLNWPIPGSVMGLMGLWVALVINGGVPEWLKKPSSLLIRNMTLLFVPAGVGLINHWDRLTEHGLAMVVIITASTLLTVVLMILIFKLFRVKL